jgi:calcineurin-like phosphoesterase family protein
MSYFFTADEHLGHKNILLYCKRPFANAEEMDNEIIKRHNEIVKPEDTVYHLGDFTLKGTQVAENYIRRLNGKHIFINGSHDYWNKELKDIIELKVNDKYIVLCHYPMRSWPRSFHGSIQLFGHCHGSLKPEGKQIDIGVDTHDFYPYSLEEILNIVK